MPTPTTCPDCGGALAEGFVLDSHQGGRMPALWVQGAPEKSLLTGTKLRGKTLYTTETYRCVDCGLLRTYARQRRR